jgi:endonuclease/exonuclease/phosphatase family metal-dependent hydrolase
MQKLIFHCLLILLSVFILGCPPTKEVKKEKPPTPPPAAVKKPALPDMTINVASIDLAKVSKKIESGEIERLTETIKKEKIDILAMQGITRYPDLKNRADIVNELSERTAMRHSFGETIALSGRQSGNAVFSAYPIRSTENTRYEGVRSTNLESAVQAIIDCGIRDVVVISTRFPDKASVEDLTTCVNKLSSLNIVYINHPIIIAGNLPASEVLRTMASYQEAKPQKGEAASRIWFSEDRSLKLLSTKVVNTPLGQIMIGEFGIFRKPQP